MRKKMSKPFGEHELAVLLFGMGFIALTAGWFLLQWALLCTRPVAGDYARSFYRAVARSQEGYQIIDERGEPVTEESYPYIEMADLEVYESRCVRFRGEDGKYGYLDVLTGRILISAVYEEAQPFMQDMAVVKEGGSWRVLWPLEGGEGRELGEYEKAGYPNEKEQIPVQNSQGQMGLVDAGGAILLELTYDWLDAQYQDDLLAFRKGEEEGWLFYDEKKDAFYTVTGVQPAPVQEEQGGRKTMEAGRQIRERYLESTGLFAYEL